MPSSYTPLLRLTLPADGELVGTWGQTVNNGITSLEESSIAGTAAVPMADANQILTVANGATDQARSAVINCTGALTAQRDVVCPSSSKLYIVRNNTTGGFGINFKTAAGTGVIVPAGQSTMVYCDGVNVMPAVSVATGPFSLVDGVTLGDAAADPLTINSNTASIPNNLNFAGGNVGIGVTPSTSRLDVNGAVAVRGSAGSNFIDLQGAGNASPPAGMAYGLFPQGGVGLGLSSSVAMAFWTSGAERMRIDTAGNLLVGVTSGSRHELNKPAAAEGTSIFAVLGAVAAAIECRAVDGFGANGANAALIVQRNAANNRSINAGGTINASGADYAEYEPCGALVIAPGAVVGFKTDGVLTLTFAEAVRFGIKSTSPAYVGGDAWGTPEALGLPLPAAPATQVPVEPIAPVLPEDPTPEQQNAYDAAVAAYDAAVLAYPGLLADYNAAQAAYAAEKATFDAALEAARLAVDRVAYSGKVPVNVLGATPGDYIIAVDNAGVIDGVAVTTPTFDQYRMAVGRVNKILGDGRAEVAVIVH